jgi:uncharacterized protein YcfJ
MKKLLITTAILVSTATASFAQEYARITKIEPRYTTGYQDTPTTQCQDVEVPIYGNVQGGGNAVEGAIGGAIVGAIIGEAIGGKNERNAGAIFGAIVGGDKATNGSSRQIIGYEIQRQCSEVMTRTQVNRIRDYRITFEWNGVYGSQYTYNNYSVGQRIPVTVSIRAK